VAGVPVRSDTRPFQILGVLGEILIELTEWLLTHRLTWFRGQGRRAGPSDLTARSGEITPYAPLSCYFRALADSPNQQAHADLQSPALTVSPGC
jgi:hypothetical protein